MKNTLSLLAIGLMFAGSVGCSSAPKEEPTTEPVVAAAEELEEAPAVDQPTEQFADEAPTEMAPATTSDWSLGAGSSGRGH